MKKSIFLLTAISAMLVSASAFAEVAGHIYSTDIVAYINGRQIESYNIGGKTAVVVEDLYESSDRNYGFSGWYDEEKRLLNCFTSNYKGWGEGADVQKAVPGKIVGDIYTTDIKVMFNAKEVTGYNIGGRTVVAIEDIATVDETSPNYDYGYSKYLCKFTYDDTAREIYMDTYVTSGSTPIEGTKLQFAIKDNELTCTFDQMNQYNPVLHFDISEEFSQNESFKLMPLYMDNEIVGEMYLHEDNGFGGVRYDTEKIKEKTAGMEVIFSLEEAQKYVEENFVIADKQSLENGFVYIAEKDGKDYLLYALKNAGFINAFEADYPIFELREDEELGMYLYYYPTAGTPGSGLVGVCQQLSPEYYTFGK